MAFFFVHSNTLVLDVLIRPGFLQLVSQQKPSAFPQCWGSACNQVFREIFVDVVHFSQREFPTLNCG